MPYTPILATLAYVVRGDEVLLVHRTFRHDDAQRGKFNGLGGKLEPGEDVVSGLRRELHEEAGLIIEGRPTLISVHANERFFRGDHVLVYRIDRFSMTDRTSHGEIAEVGWFDPAALPEDTHRATRDRLTEIFGGADIATSW